QNDYDAKFSIHFAVAAAAVRGRFTLDELEPDARNDATILALCDRTTYRDDPDSRYPDYYSGGVIVETRDGRTLERREPINRGADSRRLTADAVKDKFLANATIRIPSTQAETLWAAVQSLDSASSLDDVATLLRGN
ncbi:MAG: MmgE/PrpD family protein, partial [Pseudomonadota bacterium]